MSISQNVHVSLRTFEESRNLSSDGLTMNARFANVNKEKVHDVLVYLVAVVNRLDRNDHI